MNDDSVQYLEEMVSRCRPVRECPTELTWPHSVEPSFPAFNRAGYIQVSDSNKPAFSIHTMLDLALKRSFDSEAKSRYLSWLERRYSGDIATLNRRYGVTASSFYELGPADYWPESDETLDGNAEIPSAEDFQNETPDLWRWLDNQNWIAEEIEAFFKTMPLQCRALDVEFPALVQWVMFFTLPSNQRWEPVARALDPYCVAPYLAPPVCMATPMNPEGDADPYALSAELSILRNANIGRPYIAGIFLGEEMHRDLYRVVPPAEVIGTAAAHGAAGLHVYGYGGTEEGRGVIEHLESGFKTSVRVGNHWLKRVQPKLANRKRLQEAAILFPRASHLFEPMLLEQGRQHRMDLLGWYRQLTDLGFNVDLVHPNQVKSGAAANYRLIVLPTDACYRFACDADLENALVSWVNAGGVCLHGPDNLIAQNAFGIAQLPVEFDFINVGDRLLIPDGWKTVAYPEIQPLATYQSRGSTALGTMHLGQGRVLSVGFPYGFAYSTNRKPASRHGRLELEAVGLQMMETNPIVNELRSLLPKRWSGGRGIETGWFENAVVVVNHLNVRVSLAELLDPGSEADWQIQTGNQLIIPHSAVYVQKP